MPTAAPEPIRLEFARKLRRLMADKGWNQAALAREMTRFAPDGVAIERYNVNRWVTGRGMPTDNNLSYIAKAFGIAEADLTTYSGPSVVNPNPGQPPMRVTMAEDGEHAFVTINQLVPMAAALEILNLLQKVKLEEAAHA